MTAADGQASDSRPPVFGAAAKSKEFFDHLEAHYRECKRKKVDIDAGITIVLEDGKINDKGTARVKDVSPTGALLSDISLKKGAWPASTFSIETHMLSGDYKGIVFRCKPVRFVQGQNSIGVQFEEVSVDSTGKKRK